MDDYGNGVKLHSGPIGRDKEYQKSIDEGKLITDPSTFDFDEEIKKPEVKIKYRKIMEVGDFIIEESIKNCDKFKITDTVDKTFTKIYCSECLNIHTIGDYIVFPGWDNIVYFNMENGEKITEHIR